MIQWHFNGQSHNVIAYSYGWEWVKHHPYGKGSCNGNCLNIKEHLENTVTEYRLAYPNHPPPSFSLGPKSFADFQRLIGLTGPSYQVLQIEGRHGPIAVTTSSGPVICKVCRFKNDFGAPNQKDGGYICYMCR